MKHIACVFAIATSFARDPACKLGMQGSQSGDGKRVCDFRDIVHEAAGLVEWITLPPCDKKHENDKSHGLTCTLWGDDTYEWVKLSDKWTEYVAPRLDSQSATNEAEERGFECAFQSLKWISTGDPDEKPSSSCMALIYRLKAKDEGKQ